MSSLKKNIIYSSAYQILVIVLPLITAPYIARVLGAEGVGEYSYTHSVANYFLLMAMLGINQHGNRAIAETGDDIERRRKAFWGIYTIQATTNIGAIIIYAVYMVAFVGENSLIPWIQFVYVISGLFDISWLFFGMEKFQITVVRNTVIKILTVILIFCIVKNADDLWKYTLIMAAGTLFSQIYLWKYVNKYVPFIKINIDDIKRQISPILILFLPVLAYSIYKVMDKIMLGAMADYVQVGYYENAYKINSVPIGLITAIGNVMLPRTTALIAAKKYNESQIFVKKTFSLVNVVAAAMVFGIAAVSNDFIVWYYGVDFKACAPLMVCLNWTIFFVAWANIMRTQYLIPHKRDKVYVTSTLLGALFNLILNSILIPHYQAMGAAIGTLVAEFTVMAVQLCCINKEIPVLKYIKASWPYYLDGVVMYVIIQLSNDALGHDFKGLMLQIMLGGSIYVLLALVIAFVRKDDVYQFLQSIVQKRKKI